MSQIRPAQLQAVTTQSTMRHIQSPVERGKKIVANAMKEQKIFKKFGV